MKKIIAIFLTTVLTLSLSACGDSTNESQSNETTESTSSDMESKDDTASTEEDSSSNESETNTGNVTASSDSNILIVYFAVAENSEVDAVSSASVVTVNETAQGMTKTIADMIQAKVGGDLFSIDTSVVYPAGRDDVIDLAADEQDDDIRPEVINHIDNFDEYDTIFVGFPIWWYQMPMVMYSFFDEYDFSGKTIIPFSVHNGSGLSETPDDILELEPNATVITEGFTVNERNVLESEADVDEWLEGLGY